MKPAIVMFSSEAFQYHYFYTDYDFHDLFRVKPTRHLGTLSRDYSIHSHRSVALGSFTRRAENGDSTPLFQIEPGSEVMLCLALRRWMV